MVKWIVTSFGEYIAGKPLKVGFSEIIEAISSADALEKWAKKHEVLYGSYFVGIKPKRKGKMVTYLIFLKNGEIWDKRPKKWSELMIKKGIRKKA